MGAVQTMPHYRSKRTIKTRKFYTAGNGADGRWVEGATTTAMSIQKQGLMLKHIILQSSLQMEEDEDSDATVVMKDDAEEDTYSISDDMNICNTVRTKDEDEIYGATNRNFRHATNTKMLFLL